MDRTGEAARRGPRGFVAIGFKFSTMMDVEDPLQFAYKIGVHYTLAVATDDIKQKFGGIEDLPTTMLYDRLGSTCYHSYMRANVRTPRSEGACQIPCFKGPLVRKLQRQLPPDSALEETEALFGALADRVRVKILFALSRGEELCVCDVAHVLGVSISTASHHLRKLRDLKLLKYRNDGKMTCYSLRNKLAAKLVADVLEEVRT